MGLKSNILTTDGSYDKPKVRQVLYDHRSQIIESSEVVAILGDTALKFRNNLYGLFEELGIPRNLWNLTKYINNLNVKDDHGMLTKLLSPNPSYVERLVRSVNTQSRSSF